MKMNERIRSRRKDLKLTQAVISKLIGVNRVTVTGWESGDYEPGGANLQALAAALKCNPSWLLTGEGDPEDDSTLPASNPFSRFAVKEVPLISWVQAGEWPDTGSPVIRSLHSETVLTTAVVSDLAFALTVCGDSMTNPTGAPSIPEGSLIVVDPEVCTPGEANGKIVIARIEGSSEATLKKFVVDGPTKYLVPLNPNYKILEINGNYRLVGIVRQVIMNL
ncbi:LexA family protein [Tatumella punctata]|uniref:LexA family protein n=1 Tax=Tatumella punctata TaxID=399969 RepID=A0ABW1VMU8_9GAMM